MVKDLTTGRPMKVLWNFTLPIIGGNLFQLFYTLADTLIVGQTIGAEALAAVGATSIFVYFILCFIQGLTGGFGIILAQMFGSKNMRGLKRSIVASTILCVVFTVIVTPLSCIFSSEIVNWLKVPKEIQDPALTYMVIILAGTGATVFYNMISNILRAVGDSKIPLIYLIFSSLLNIVLDYVLIMPAGMGIAGAAWATVISQLLSAVLCTVSALKKYEILRVGKRYWTWRKWEIGRHLRLGFPMGFQMSVMCIGQLAMQSAVNALGTDAIAGYTAATKVDQMSILVNGAFGLAISSYVAQNYGARLIDRVKKGVVSCLVMILATDVLIGVFILFLEPFIVPVFVSNPTEAIFQYAHDFFVVTLPFYPVLGLLNLYRSSVQSLGNTFAPFAACIVELIARVVCALGLAIPFGYKGICFATPLAWLGAIAVVIPFYFVTIRKLSRQEKAGH